MGGSWNINNQSAYPSAGVPGSSAADGGSSSPSKQAAVSTRHQTVSSNPFFSGLPPLTQAQSSASVRPANSRTRRNRPNSYPFGGQGSIFPLEDEGFNQIGNRCNFFSSALPDTFHDTSAHPFDNRSDFSRSSKSSRRSSYGSDISVSSSVSRDAITNPIIDRSIHDFFANPVNASRRASSVSQATISPQIGEVYSMDDEKLKASLEKMHPEETAKISKDISTLKANFEALQRARLRKDENALKEGIRSAEELVNGLRKKIDSLDKKLDPESNKGERGYLSKLYGEVGSCDNLLAEMQSEVKKAEEGKYLKDLERQHQNEIFEERQAQFQLKMMNLLTRIMDSIGDGLLRAWGR